MQVLGDLVRLPSLNALPLPWWHRAPLGLQSGTRCYVAWVKNQTRDVPDIVVSVLRPTQSQKMVWLRMVGKEKPGVVLDAIRQLTDVNIALAESATLEGGAMHEVTFVCEPPFPGAVLPDLDVIRKRLIAAGFPKPKLRSFEECAVLQQRPARIESGWIPHLDWRTSVRKFASQEALDDIDLTRAVVSADTSSRLLRFMFPRRGARTVRVEHWDSPGILGQIAEVLHRHGFNMLSMLLRRGGAKGGNAILVAVCEPPGMLDSAGAAFSGLQSDLESFPPECQIEVSILDCIRPDTAITPHDAATVVARVPDDLKRGVREIRSKVPSGAPAVFLSHRLTREHNAQRNEEEVRQAIVDAGGYPLLVDLSGVSDKRQVVYSEVMKNLWAADAGIIFMPKLERSDPLGRNIPHEYGFLEGQNKPVIMMVERGERGLEEWTNVAGIFVSHFAPGHQAVVREDADSIYAQTYKWVQHLKNGADGETG